MAKKPAVRKASAVKTRPSKPAAKPASAKKAKAPVKKPAPVRKPVPASKTAKKPVAKTAASKTPTKSPPKPVEKAPSLGRPLVTAEEKLYMLFKEDYHARQIFEFLRVNTVGELEQYSPQQIIQILSSPVRKTVERIRQRLAENKRSLRDDAEFARDHIFRDDG